MKLEGHFPTDSGPHILSSVRLSARKIRLLRTVDGTHLLLLPSFLLEIGGQSCILYTVYATVVSVRCGEVSYGLFIVLLSKE